MGTTLNKKLMAHKLPYVPSYGLIGKVLDKIKAAATPSRFTQDFLGTKLAMSGGSARSLIPFLKRVGFLGTDGVPTDLYKRFRNPSEAGAAAAEALKIGYQALYEINEYAHDLSEKDLKGLIVQVTGLEPKSSTTTAVIGSFKALKSVSTFDGEAEAADDDEEDEPEALPPITSTLVGTSHANRFGLSYTINLNLPATSDIAVFNAIFKSLREHLLR